MSEVNTGETDFYEFSELYGRPEYIAHEAAPGRVTVCGLQLDDLLAPDACEAGLPERRCATCHPN